MRGLKCALVHFHSAFVLRDGRLLRVESLRGNGALRERGLIAGEIEARVLQHRLIASELTLRLYQRGLIRTRVNDGEQVAFVDDLPFAVVDRHQLPGHAAGNGDRVNRRDGAERVDVDADVAL